MFFAGVLAVVVFVLAGMASSGSSAVAKYFERLAQGATSKATKVVVEADWLASELEMGDELLDEVMARIAS